LQNNWFLVTLRHHPYFTRIMVKKTDNEIFAEIRSGSKDAFEFFFLKYYENLCTYAYGILRDKYSSEEVVQEMFIKLWENRQSLIIEVSAKSYIYRTVHNQCLNYINHLNVRQKYTNDKISENKHVIITAPLSDNYPIANLLVQELEEKIEKAIAKLPNQCREVFLLCRYEELSYAETAKRLGVSINTVKTQLKRAMARLRDELKEYLPLLIPLLLLFSC
jgi:RNA polymerase sigma-70 factor (family 1)